jgi:hypothetical protein
MTPETIESVRESVARGDLDAWEAETAVRRLVSHAEAAMERGDLVLAAEHYATASDIARYIDESVNGWLKEFQAMRIA